MPEAEAGGARPAPARGSGGRGSVHPAGKLPEHFAGVGRGVGHHPHARLERGAQFVEQCDGFRRRRVGGHRAVAEFVEQFVGIAHDGLVAAEQSMVSHDGHLARHEPDVGHGPMIMRGALRSKELHHGNRGR